MTKVTIEEAQANLKELIHQMRPGEELIITENQQAVAKLLRESPPTSSIVTPTTV
jgi:antitoxin (DNA-binding transcriptional repressor) of toxin-antitoxin stability system